MALPWPLTFSSGERPRALWALLFFKYNNSVYNLQKYIYSENEEELLLVAVLRLRRDVIKVVLYVLYINNHSDY